MLLAVIGDVHGRFLRVEAWVAALEAAHGRPVDCVLAVGDVETFPTADDDRRKGAKRSMPAEFAAYTTGVRRMPRPFVFVGGNNEAFDDLDAIPDGGELAPNVRYLGRAGLTVLPEGPRIAYLSGIYAPTRFDRPRVRASSHETSKQAGYFRQEDIATVMSIPSADMVLVHEWPRGIAGRESAVARSGARGIRQGHWPTMGNPHAAAILASIRPPWALCGHFHVPHAATLPWDDATVTRVACLDQASRAEAGLLWMDWAHGAVQSVGWGTSARPSWTAGDPWDERQTSAQIVCDHG